MEHETGVTVVYMNGDTASTRGRRHTVTDPAMHTQRTRAPLETRTNRRGASKAGGPSSQPPPRASAEPGAESGKTACPAKAPDPQPEVLTGAEERARAGCGWMTRDEWGIVLRARSMRGPFCCLWPVRAQNTLSPGSPGKVTTRPSMTSYLRA